MYEYRKLTDAEKKAVVRARLSKGYPAHRPPHPIRDGDCYFVTATCYEHFPHLHTFQRRETLQSLLAEQLALYGVELCGWVILLTHYHILVRPRDFDELSRAIGRIHGATSFRWNGEDSARGRRIWYRYYDRVIRSANHYNAALNYIHHNPVKHGLVESPFAWEFSSIHWYLGQSVAP